MYPKLDCGLAVTEPDRLWRADITYIRLRKGFVYRTVVIDGFS